MLRDRDESVNRIRAEPPAQPLEQYVRQSFDRHLVEQVVGFRLQRKQKTRRQPQRTRRRRQHDALEPVAQQAQQAVTLVRRLGPIEALESGLAAYVLELDSHAAHLGLTP